MDAGVIKSFSWETLKTMAAAITAVAGILFTIGAPWAENYIVKVMDGKVRELESTSRVNTIRLGEVKNQQNVIIEKLRKGDELDKETRQDIKQILILLQQRPVR